MVGLVVFLVFVSLVATGIAAYKQGWDDAEHISTMRALRTGRAAKSRMDIATINAIKSAREAGRKQS